MALDIEGIAWLLSGNSEPISIGRIVNQARTHLSQKTSVILLSTDSTRHILTKHGDHMEASTLLLLPEALRLGLWITDRDYSCRVSFEEKETGVRYLAAVKATKDRREIYLSTFHRAQKGQTKSVLKRGTIVRNHL